MSYTTPFHTSCVSVRWKLCRAYRASFWHILKKVTACFSSCVWNNKLMLLVPAFSKKNSVISLEEWVLVFKLITTATRKWRVKSLLLPMQQLAWVAVAKVLDVQLWSCECVDSSRYTCIYKCIREPSQAWYNGQLHHSKHQFNDRFQWCDML